jgi:hypothetical protein
MSRTRFDDLSGLKKAALVWLILLGIFVLVEFTCATVYFVTERYFSLFGESTFLRPTIYEMAYRTVFGRGTVPGSLDRYVFPYADVGRVFARFTARYGYDPWLAYRQLPLTSFQGLGIDRYGFYHNGDEKRELLPKEGRLFRIFILGGSTMAGLGASSNTATIPAQLEKMLNERAGWPKQKHFEVINAGVPGYTSAQELALFALELVHYEPDMVSWIQARSATADRNTSAGV